MVQLLVATDSSPLNTRLHSNDHYSHHLRHIPPPHSSSPAPSSTASTSASSWFIPGSVAHLTHDSLLRSSRVKTSLLPSGPCHSLTPGSTLPLTSSCTSSSEDEEEMECNPTVDDPCANTSSPPSMRHNMWTVSMMDVLLLCCLMFLGALISTSFSGSTTSPDPLSHPPPPAAAALFTSHPLHHPHHNGSSSYPQYNNSVPPHITNQHEVLGRVPQIKRKTRNHSDLLEVNDEPNFEPNLLIRERIHSPPVRLTGKNAFLRREMFKNTSITCNDGTPAGYYVRPHPSSSRWLIFLEGGWHCFSPVSCHQRWLRARPLMTSAHWPQMRSMGGILSLNPDENPFWAEANHVLIPYCSSDSWTGTSGAKNPGDFSFLGSAIVQEVFKQLMSNGMYDAELILMAGSSAGAVGVMANLDRMSDYVSSTGSRAQVRGLADSGWFLDNKPFADPEGGHRMAPNCDRSPHTCAPEEGIRMGYHHWKGRVPDACSSQFRNEPWKCYFGYHIYPTLRTPLFVVQWVFDEAQMTADSVGNPVTRAQWNYIHKLGQDVKKSLSNVTALFAPSCVSHGILTRR